MFWTALFVPSSQSQLLSFAHSLLVCASTSITGGFWRLINQPDSTFTPLIFSGIFYASNGRFHIAYIDALFNSVSAMAVCGLASVDLSSLTGWQQAILFIQMCIGNPVCQLFEQSATPMSCNWATGLDVMGRGLC
jgi:hypothetical protein